MAKVADFQSFYDESVAPFVKTCSELKGCEKIVSAAVAQLSAIFVVDVMRLDLRCRAARLL